MDLQKIKALIDLLAESPLASLEVIEGDERVKLVKSKRRGKRGSDARLAGDGLATPHAASASASEAASQQPSAVASMASVANEDDASRTAHVIQAPMFGVVHLTPAPGEAPFAKLGDTVEAGQVLCTIEAMKMFNAIECEHGGTVLDILVEPGSEVESGQPLFRIG
ncbi:acetyl-CoA carboxylase biotin carboxyl carrier protein [Paraburkholderia phosphatilytica]|uniref:acetyl-CoA carboxylase biotin carboxyl carrier protein n=1 Tax=Paraburkholderia phosphatilytica TaxID=2282883 RepID=UPI000E4D1559|nr:acetyl-CoA carboxylase biotin carboxyl carrier protein [Paraburkholderia phosphatilytica]